MKVTIVKLILIVLILPSNIYALEKLGIGTIDAHPKEKIYKFKILADYLQEKLKEKEIQFNIEIPEDIQNTIAMINNNKLDIFIDSIYPTLLVKEKTDLIIDGKRWKDDSSGYRSIIFTKKDSKINSINDLKGKTIAFESEFSTSGFYIAKKNIEKNGIKISKNSSIQNLKYIFSGSEQNCAAWVLFSKVDAGVTDDRTFKTFDKNLFKVIYKSKLIPRQLVSFSKRIDKKLKDEIKNILFAMHKDRKGIKVLKEFSDTKKFSSLTDDDIKIIKGL